ncbi:MAG: WbqC family protein [bacterium]|nr:WbqC family protein [bacterium]
MLVAIHQPHYLPWLRYFDKILRSDVFIVLDTVDYSKNGWQNRNKIKTAAGAHTLTVPVTVQLGQAIREVQITTGAPWRKKHWRTIEQSYSKAPFFAEYAPFLEATYVSEWENLGDLNWHMLEYFVQTLGIQTRIVRASDLDVPGEATDRLVNLVKSVGGTRYYSGAFALEQYLDARKLEEAGIALDLQQWHAPRYPQLHGDFVPDLSIVDLLMNCGPDSLSILKGETVGDGR